MLLSHCLVLFGVKGVIMKDEAILFVTMGLSAETGGPEVRKVKLYIGRDHFYTGSYLIFSP